MSKTIKELKELIKTDIIIGEKMNEGMEHSENPQVKETYIKECARLETLKGVLAYCEKEEKYAFRKMKDYEEFFN